MIIDDSGIFDLHSDHVVLNIKFKESFRREDKFCNVSGKSYWKIDENIDWSLFCNNLEIIFSENWANTSNDINRLWDIWKENVNRAAESVVQKVHKVKKISQFLG